MRKKQLVLYIAMFVAALLAILGIGFAIRSAIRAGNLAGIDWYDVNKKEFVISTEEELYEFATLSDYYDFEGQTIKLGADIVVNEGNAEDWKANAPEKKWQPITEFAGTFDGQGHSISGLYGKSSSMSMGLFSKTKKTCVIKDFSLLNSFFTNTTNNGLGSILGEGAGKITKVYSDAIIYGTGESNGGIAGLIKDELTLKECWFDGQVSATQRSNGGMIGWVDRKADVKIDNCLNSGLIQFLGEGGSSSGGFVGNISELAYRTDVSQVEITNSLTTGEIEATNMANTGSAVGVVRKLGALTLDNTYAVIKVTDDVGTENTIGSVNGQLVGNVIPRYKETLKGEGGYQWTNLDFDKYWSCVEDGTPVLKHFTKNEVDLTNIEKKVDTSWYKEGETEFVLKDTADFWGFAMISASTNFEGVTIKLDADITLNEGDSALWKESAPEYNWFPCYTFSGNFDGQGHTISGVYCYTNSKYIGVFKQVNANGSVRDLKLVNSYIRGTYCVGAIAGHGGGSLSLIYTDAIVENTGDHTGGILGAMNQNGNMSECWFDGTVYGGKSYTGGLTSATGTAMCVISHSLNTGTVYGGTGQVTGGLVGLVNRSLTLSDSLNAGKVDDSLSAIKDATGSVIGRITDSNEEKPITTHISSTYATRESYETSIGKGYPTSGSSFVNSLAELTGNNGYRRTILNFDKYWAIDVDSHPTLQAFTEEIPTLPKDVKRPYTPDTSWYDDDENVFVLKTVEELYGFVQLAGKKDFEGKTVKLGKDMKVNAGDVTALGTSTPLNQWASIHSFNGTFDGCGHTISGLYINDGLWRVGLFGNITENATIKNVKLTNSYFEGAYHVGSICGWLQESTIQGVYSEAKVVVRKGHGGGILGTTQNGKIDNAWFAGSVSGEANYIGGIASFVSLRDKDKNNGATFSNCLNTGTVSGVSNVGGLVGRVAARTTIKYSLNTGKVTGANATGSAVGFVVADEHTRCNIAEGVYASKESSKNSVGSGVARGSVIVNTTAELTGVGGYRRTILDFNKYWSIVETSTPVLKKFGGTTVAMPNVARATAPDTSWYKANKKTYVLEDYADFYGFAVLAGSNDFTGKTIKLGANIVANSGSAEDFKANTPLNQLVSVGAFSGTFDGQGYTISGLSANNDGAWYVGLFNNTLDGAVIKNLKVENSYIAGEYHIGSIVGIAEGVTIENVYSDAILEASKGHVGGMAGTVKGKSAISNCWFDGSASAKEGFAGGMTSFVSSDTALTISHCLNTAPIKAVTQAAGFVGRVVAKLTITDSLNTGVITGAGSSGSVVGMILDDGKVTLDAVYGTKESATYVVGNGTEYSGDTGLLSKAFLEEHSGYTLTNLNFDKYWTALKGDTPKLTYFSDKITSEKVSLKGVDHMDTRWYSADKKSYVLNDRADLFGFTYLVNSGNTFEGKTVTLGKDIKVNDGDASDWEDGKEAFYKWMPIGSYEGHTDFRNAFMGTFNGKMHSISGLYTKRTGDANKMYNWCAGLFGKTGESATVKNVKVLNSYFESPYYSGVVGYSTGTSIDTVYTEAIVCATTGNTGGVVGSAKGGYINNIWFNGTVTNSGQFTGGIVGVVHDKVTLSNCLTTGEVKSTTQSYSKYIGGLVGGVIGTVLVTDSISIPKTLSVVTESPCIGAIVGGVNKGGKTTVTNTYTLNGITKVAVGQLEKAEANGEITDLSNICADLTGLNGYSLTKLDFAYYWVALAGKTPELMSFSTEKALAVDTSFRSSTKWYTDAVADVDGNAPGTEANPYVLYNKVDLYGFADLVNKGTTFKGKYIELGADITVNVTDASKWEKEAPNYVWEPIGSYVGHTDYSKSFAGHFDGKEYTISGLYTKKTGADNNTNNWCAGLFGRTSEGASVKNVSVINSYFESPYYNAVIGHATNTVIENVYTDAIVDATSGNSGGIVGALMGGSVDGSWFAGIITSKGQMIGGIVGLANGDATINNCLTTGTVKSTHSGTSAFAGGLVGAANGNMSLTNSVSAAKEVSSKGDRTGSVFGSALSGTVEVAMENVYSVVDVHQYAVGAGATGKYFGQPKVMSTLDGYNAYTLTKLDFDNTWIALAGKTPELKMFSTGKVLNVADSFRPDTDWEGQGTEENPYVISSKAELYGLAEMVNEGTTFAGQYIVLSGDITVNSSDAAGYKTTAPDYAWLPIGRMLTSDTYAGFAGTFNGNGHSISGLYAENSSQSVHGGTKWYIGLFGAINGGTVENVTVTNSYFEGDYHVASVVGMAVDANLYAVSTDAIVVANQGHAGGIIGTAKNATTIEHCWFNGNVTAKGSFSGAITSFVSGSGAAIRHCLSTGTISGTSETGGIVGRIGGNLSITDSLVTATVIATGSNNGLVTGNQASGTLTFDSVYGYIKSDMENGVTELYGKKGTFNGTPQQITELSRMYGEGAYILTELDFENNWVLMQGEMPHLDSFVDDNDSKIIDVNGWYQSASGTESDPYVLDSIVDLYGFAKRVNAGNNFEGKVIALGASIDVNTTVMDSQTDATTVYQWKPIGSQGKKFAGTFDGKGYTISGLYTNITTASGDGSANNNWYAGLFGTVNTTASIKDISIKNSYFKANHYAGSIVGLLEAGTIENVYSEAHVETRLTGAGGIVGYVNSSGVVSIQDSWFKGTATSGSLVCGGIVGASNGTQPKYITNCLNEGAIQGTQWVGGLVGNVVGETHITDCINVGTVQGNTQIGSAVGRNASTCIVEDVYVLGSTSIGTGSVTGTISTFTDKEFYYGEGAYLLTNLDFENDWVLMQGEIPKPNSLVSDDDPKIIDVNAWFEDADADAEGNAPGTEKNPYVIDTKGELYNFAKRVNSSTDGFNGKHFVLADDITLGSIYSWIPIGTSSKPFKGTFDGNGYSVTELYANGSKDAKNKWYVGMFGYLNGAAIKNLKVLDSQFQGEHYVGSVAGTAMNSTIDTVYTNATIIATSGSSGGMIGHLSDGTIRNSWFDGQITIASQIVGGIAGLGNGSGIGANLVDCLVTGKIIANKASGQVYAGGILGIVNSGSAKITNCLSTPKEFTTKSGVTNVDPIIGGGSSRTTISGAYAVNGSNADDYKGVNGYLNTKLEFDRPETQNQTEGCWVATESTPVLKSFFDMQNAKEVDITGNFRVDTEWSLTPVKKLVDGVEKDTYTIDRPEELLGLANKVNGGTNFDGKVIYLGADIVVNTAVMNSSTDKNTVQQWTPIGTKGKKFSGTFDGQGYTITGLYSDISNSTEGNATSGYWYAGLFGTVNTTSVIKNFSLKNSFFKANHYAGSVAGLIEAGTIENVYSEANVATRLTGAGGIVGQVNSSSKVYIQECWFKGTVTAGSLVGGGIVGTSGGTQSKYITNCLNEGTIKGTQWVGGLVGNVVGETHITDCLNVGTVQGNSQIGSALGRNASTCIIEDVYVLISNSVSSIGTGNVTGTIATFEDKSAYYGNNALSELQNKWNFNDVWTVRQGDTPALKSWCK